MTEKNSKKEKLYELINGFMENIHINNANKSLMSKEDYGRILSDQMDNELPIRTIPEYFNAISALSATSKGLLFRGQSDKNWNIESSAYRFLKQSMNRTPTQKDLRDYHLKLIEDVQNLRDKSTEEHKGISLLAHLQHHYAKTSLIDYTYNPLVALWFACNEEKNKTACVYCIENCFTGNIFPIDENNLLETLFKSTDKIYVYHPSHINQRIINQQSVFLIGWRGVIDKYQHRIITISSEYKQSILDELALFGISRKTLFPDFHGFVEWFLYERDDKKICDSCAYKARECLDNPKPDLDNAFHYLHEAVDFLNDADTKEKAYLYHQLGFTHFRNNEYDKALAMYQKVLNIRKKEVINEHPDTAITQNDMALVYMKLGEYEKALPLFQDALKTFEAILGERHPKTAYTYNSIAINFRENGYYSEALTFGLKALSISEEILGKEHIETAYINSSVAAIYDKLNQDAKAIEEYEKAMKLYIQILGGEISQNIAYVSNKLGLVYNKKSQRHHRDKALELTKKALYICEVIYGIGNKNPNTAFAYNSLAEVYKEKGDYKEALAQCEKALEIDEEKLSTNHPKTAYVYENKAEILHKTNQFDDSLIFHLKAYKILIVKLRIEHPDVLYIKDNMKLTYKETNNTQPFEEWLKEKLN